MNLYVLDENNEPVETNFETWSQFITDNNKRQIKFTQISKDKYVSTIFVGVDFSFGIGPERKLFETAVFDGHEQPHIVRYSTYEKAIQGHDILVKIVESVQ